MEKFKTIENYEHYQISTEGRILTRYDKYLKPQKLKGGYYVIRLCKEGKSEMHYIHRLVCQTFLPNPEEKRCVNHKNCNKGDNRLENLEWCTHTENMKHAYDNGLVNYKSALGLIPASRKLEAVVIEIINKYSTDKYTQSELAKEYFVTQSTIQKIVTRVSYKDIKI